MVDALIPQAIRIKAKFKTDPALCDDYEVAACIGLICQDMDINMPQGDDLDLILQEFRQMKGVDPQYMKLLLSFEPRGNRPDWRRLMECGYHYKGQPL